MFEKFRTPNFERLVTTLRGGKADCVPQIELGVHPAMKSRILGRTFATLEDDIEFMRVMGYDYVKIQPGFALEKKRKTGVGVGDPGGSTDVSDRDWAPEGTGVITSWKEFDEYRWPATSDIDYSRLERAKGLLPEGMGIIGQYGDIFTSVWEMMGFETFAFATVDQPDLISAMFDKVGSLIMSMFDTMADMEWVGALWCSDDIAYTSGLFLNPDFFRQHLFPLLRRIGDRARERNIPFLFHSDGKLWEVMDDLIGCGITAIHPIEPKAMDIRELKSKLGGKIGLCGGIDVDLLARSTPDQIRELSRTYLRDIAPGGGWCAGSSNSIPDYVTYENYVAMVETVIKEGTY